MADANPVECEPELGDEGSHSENEGFPPDSQADAPSNTSEVEDEDEENARDCELCGAKMSARKGKWGLFWGCENYFVTGCKFTRRDKKKKKETIFILEIEGRGEFRVHLRLPPTAKRGKKVGSVSKKGGAGNQGEAACQEGGAKGKERKPPDGSAPGRAKADVEARQAKGPVSRLKTKSPPEEDAEEGRDQVEQEQDGEGPEGKALRTALALARLVPLRINRREDGVFGAVFALDRYEIVKHRVQALPDVRVKPIPPPTLNFFRRLEETNGNPWDGCREGHEDSDDGHEDRCGGHVTEGGEREDAAKEGEREGMGDRKGVQWWEGGKWMERIGEGMRRALLPFQKEGVQQGGRALIADEMGLGKTLQALAVTAALRAWPLLVVCPATVRLVWAEEVERWLPSVTPRDMHVVFGSSSRLPLAGQTPKVVITSYAMLRVLEDDLVARRWGMLVLDESHTVSTTTASASEVAQTQATLRLSACVPYVVALSGTPSLSRPFGMYNQVTLLREGLLGRSKFVFGMHYCSGKHTENGSRTRDSGARGSGGGVSFGSGGGVCGRAWELHSLLKEAVMIRRVKKDVLSELPAKRRQLVRVQVNVCSSRRQEKTEDAEGEGRGDGDERPFGDAETEEEVEREEAQVEKGEEGASNGGMDYRREDGGEDEKGRKPMAYNKYQAVGLAKIDEGVKWLRHLLKSSTHTHKVVVFGHHRAVLDGVLRGLLRHSIGAVRIDGETLVRQRAERIRDFHADPAIRVAIVSVTAGGQGINLSCASLAVFFEIPPDCGWVAQAEDRLHRRGQARGVVVCYLVAYAGPDGGEKESELEDYDMGRWTAVARMIKAISEVTDGPSKSQGLDAEAIRGFAESLDSIGIDEDSARDSRQARAKPASGLPILQKSPSGSDDENVESAENTPSKGDANRAAVFFEVSVHTGRVHVHMKGDGSEPLGVSLSQATVDAWDGADVQSSPEVAELAALLERRRKKTFLAQVLKYGSGKRRVEDGITSAFAMAEAKRFLAQYRRLSPANRRLLRYRCCCCEPSDVHEPDPADQIPDPIIERLDSQHAVFHAIEAPASSEEEAASCVRKGRLQRGASPGVLGKRGAATRGGEAEADVFGAWKVRKKDAYPGSGAGASKQVHLASSAGASMRDSSGSALKASNEQTSGARAPGGEDRREGGAIREAAAHLEMEEEEAEEEGRAWVAARKRPSADTPWWEEDSSSDEEAISNTCDDNVSHPGPGDSESEHNILRGVEEEEEGEDARPRAAVPVGSKRRVTPKGEAPGMPLPEGATWWEVSVKGKKAAVRQQMWARDAEGAALCLWCMRALGSKFFFEPARRASRGEAIHHSSLFCCGDCLSSYYQRTSTQSMRRQLEEEESGVCQQCSLDCRALLAKVAVLDKEERERKIKRMVPAFGFKGREALLRRFVEKPVGGNLWHADHIVPVHAGGGECGLDNVRTLCVLCHATVTAQQAQTGWGRKLSSSQRAATPDGDDDGVGSEEKEPEEKDSGVEEEIAADAQDDGQETGGVDTLGEPQRRAKLEVVPS